MQNPTSSAIKVLDPECSFVIKWSCFMLCVGVAGLVVDLSFLYIATAKGPACSGIDVQAGVILAFFRTFLDLCSLAHIFLKFRIAIGGTGPKVFGRKRNLIRDPHLIALKYLKSNFILDLIAVLPLPQIVVLLSRSFTVDNTIWLLSVSIMIQFPPRMLASVPIDTKIVRSVGIATSNVWSGAIYNLLVFILAGHFVGVCYYQMYLSGLSDCILVDFLDQIKTSSVLDCSHVHKACISKHEQLEHGMFSDAISNEIGLRSFMQKLIYCFVWGVRSISSLGQIFDTSSEVAETTFSCMIMIAGLILLADLIARMQTSVQFAGARREEQRIKQRKIEEWTHYLDLPSDLKGLIRHSAISEWQGTKGIDDEAILNSLPHDLQRDIRTCLYKERLINIYPFSRMDEQLLNFICGHLRTFKGAEGTYIVLQGDPLDQVVFIFSGLLQLTHHSGGRPSTRSLETGDFFGDDLLTWASQPNSSTQNLPPSNFTVKCISYVEAFCLPADNVRLLVIFNYFQRFQRALREHHA